MMTYKGRKYVLSAATGTVQAVDCHTGTQITNELTGREERSARQAIIAGDNAMFYAWGALGMTEESVPTAERFRTAYAVHVFACHMRECDDMVSVWDALPLWQAGRLLPADVTP